MKILVTGLVFQFQQCQEYSTNGWKSCTLDSNPASDGQTKKLLRLILGVNLADAWYGFALWPPGLHPGLPTTHGFLPSVSSLQCLGVSCTIPRLLTLFLMVEQPLLHPNYTTIQHTQLFPPPILLHSSLWLLRRSTMEHKSLHLSQHCVFVGPSLDLLGCLRQHTVQIFHEQEITRDWNDCRSLRKWQTAQSWKQAGLEANKMHSLVSKPPA